MKHLIKNFWKTLLFPVFLLLTVEITAQTTVTGTVADEKGEPLIGVSVSINGTSTGVITSAEGVYSINAPGNSTLLFNYVGMTPMEEAVKNRKTINIVMREDKKVLDEVVVIGYGTVKKRDLTGSVASVKTSDIDLTASASIGHALKGEVAGLSVIQNSAQPGGGLDILVRGAGSVNASNRPLYVVDGLPIAQLDPLTDWHNTKMDPGTQSILNFINPNDIASVEVLKDASATAIYGARAGHGVVLITTKRGSEGRTRVNYDASYATQQITNKYDVYNLKEWMGAKVKASWDVWLFNNGVAPYGSKSLEEAIATPANGVAYRLPYTDEQIENAGPGTDWVSLITRTGYIQQHNLSVQGGNGKTNFVVSLNYFDQQGIIKNSGIKRYTGKVSLDHTISNSVKTGINLMASRTDNDNVPIGSAQWENSGIIRAAVQMGPHIQAIDESGKYPINPELPTQPNPYSLLTVTDKSRMDRLVGNAYVMVDPLPGLTLKVNAGTDIAYQSRNTYMPHTTLYGGPPPAGFDGYASINQKSNDQFLLEGTANWLKTFNDFHRIGLLAGVSYEKFINSGHYLENNEFITDAFLWYSIGSGTGDKKNVSSSGGEDKMKSFFTRLNYTLLDRYLLTATFRADGASVFAANHKWGYFPSVAAAWNFAEESFMAPSRSVLSLGKLRVSYGQTGNSSIVENAYAAYSAYAAWNAPDKKQIIGVFQSRLDNPDLKWETTTELNLGLDLAFYKGRVSGTFEFYRRVISDLLNYKPLNSYQPISQVIANIGKTQSKGFEATINTKNINGKDFTWATDFTFSMYRDRWLERTADWKPTVYQNVNDPIRPIYSRLSDHIYQTGETLPVAQPQLIPGQLVIKDIDGYKRDSDGNPVVESGRFVLLGKPDGIIDDADTRLLGTTDPGYIAGMNNRFRYKNFDFSFSLNGLFDRIMQDPTYFTYGTNAEPIAQYGYNGLRVLDKIWMPYNPSTKYPSSFYTHSNYGYGDWFYQKAWFIRLQSITLGYTLPMSSSWKKVFSALRVYVNANNLYCFTPYTGIDPETDSYTAAYPNARTITFGLNVQF